LLPAVSFPQGDEADDVRFFLGKNHGQDPLFADAEADKPFFTIIEPCIQDDYHLASKKFRSIVEV
jgi:hypothetical protein